MIPTVPEEDGTQPRTRPDRVRFVPEILFTLLALGCIAIGWAYLWPGYLDHLASDEFLPTPCHVVESRVQHTSRNWTYDLRYEYVVDGNTYHSERLGFVSPASLRSPPSLPAPGPAICYVRKGSPGTSVLRKQIDPTAGPIGLALIVVCLLFAWSAFQFRRMRLTQARRTGGA